MTPGQMQVGDLHFVIANCFGGHARNCNGQCTSALHELCLRANRSALSADPETEKQGEGHIELTPAIREAAAACNAAYRTYLEHASADNSLAIEVALRALGRAFRSSEGKPTPAVGEHAELVKRLEEMRRQRPHAEECAAVNSRGPEKDDCDCDVATLTDAIATLKGSPPAVSEEVERARPSANEAATDAPWWMIEREHGSQPIWWRGRMWTHNWREGVRFVRREDAERTLNGFADDIQFLHASVTEHLGMGK